MARDVIIATFENRNQAYDAAREIDRLVVYRRLRPRRGLR